LRAYGAGIQIGSIGSGNDNGNGENGNDENGNGNNRNGKNSNGNSGSLTLSLNGKVLYTFSSSSISGSSSSSGSSSKSSSGSSSKSSSGSNNLRFTDCALSPSSPVSNYVNQGTISGFGANNTIKVRGLDGN
jgi:hypothetical protein